ncbi:hypothetical protein POX_d05407 [Penicillium oxalicum]|uniref:hypothetical protein n=1 Tax=Penicillium oxalicum TaxID=69781 RepID=UPI0020B686AE|nr:hypothetical protein POX_d05407 [Penicillium oxalicum]KAI2789908.1 hypothetical protein POX_d05407 [Penicillium oxalicum]
MPTLRNPFRSHQQDIDPPTQARLTRARVRRSKSAAFVLDAYRPRVSAENQPLMAAENGTGGDSSFRPQYQVAPGFQLPAWAGIHDPENTELTHKAFSSNEPLPPLRGSGRFKSFLNRLRTGKPRGRKPLAGTFTMSEAPNTKQGSSMDPGQEILLPKRISSAELRAWNEERRQEALQKASLVNLATDPSKTRQHQSHHNPSTAHEKLVENRRPDVISPLPGRFRESKLSRAPSDPFSDDKAVSLDHPAEASSFHCAEPTLETPTYASQNPYKSLPYRIVDNRQATYPHGPSSLHRRSIPAFDIVRVPTMDSPSVGGSYLGRLQPELMRAQLEMMVDRLKLPLAIPPWASITSEETKTTVEGNINFTQGHRLLRRVRPRQSVLKLRDPEAPAPVPRLRRTRTFGSFVRRSEPMTSLRGISLERLALLGGHSYFSLDQKYAPGAMKLPAAIVAPLAFLQELPPSPELSQLFVYPGDMKRAIRLYDYFANQVLSATKDEALIESTVRAISVPLWDRSEQYPVLSVAWTLKALLAGLPGGLLGSRALYQLLKEINYLEGFDAAGFPQKIRTSLIAFALPGLTSPMHLALICAIFGIFTKVLREEVAAAQVARFPPRRVVSVTREFEMARVLAPLLTGPVEGAGAEMRPLGQIPDYNLVQPMTMVEVEREMERERVAGMLLELWSDISSELSFLSHWAPSVH